MLVEAVAHVLERLYRTPEVKGYKRRYRKFMARQKPGYVWLFVFTREKREADMWADNTASYFVCRAEWFDESLKKDGFERVFNFQEHAGKVGRYDVTVEWNPSVV
jgi:hypothetical protein